MNIRKVTLDNETENMLISFSNTLAAEDCLYDYEPKTAMDFMDKTIYVAYNKLDPVGYLYGKIKKNEEACESMPIDSVCFEIEEIFVKKEMRGKGIGSALFSILEMDMKENAEFITISTTTKNYKKLLHFLIDEIDMRFLKAKLFKEV